MKKSRLIGVIMLTAFLFCVGTATNASTKEKPPKAKLETSYIVSHELSVDGSTVYSFNDMEIPYQIVINEPVASPFSIKPIGTPSTKYHAQHLFHPLKLC